MRLYTVEKYGEYYFKSLRKPVLKEVRAPLKKAADEDIVSFVEDVVSVTEVVKSGLWIPEGDLGTERGNEVEFTYAAYANWESIMNEILRNKWYETHPVSLQAWKDWAALYGAWQAGYGRTQEQFMELQRLWRLTWGNMAPGDKKLWAAKQFWEGVRAHEAWKGVYEVTLRKYKGTVLEPMAPGYARMSADYHISGFLRGKVSVDELKKILGLKGCADYIAGFLGKVLTVGVAILMKVALPLIALTGVLIVIINPSSQGMRRKWYWESRLLMRYEGRVWWADMVGRSADGHGLYKRCEEVKGEMYKRTVTGRGGVLARETLWMEADEVGAVKINWFYWVTWPWYFEVRFRGYLTQIREDMYKLQECWRRGEVTPVELKEGLFGEVRARMAEWFNPRLGFPSFKDAVRWCREEKLPKWVYFEGEVP